MKRFFKRIAYLLFWLVVFVALAEVVLRITGSQRTRSEIINGEYLYLYSAEHYQSWLHLRKPKEGDTTYSNPDYSYSLYLNNESLRDTNHQVEKKSMEYRVMGLGDSFTEGMGAPFDSTWLNLLIAEWQVQLDSVALVPINAGVAGSDPFFEYQLLKQRMLKYDPDLLILAINKTDVDDFFIRGGEERFRENGKVVFNAPPWEEWWHVRSHFARVVLGTLGYNYQLVSPGKQKEKYTAFVSQLKQLMSGFKTLADKNDFKLLVVVHPLDGEVFNSRYNYDFDQIFTMMKQEKIPCIDMLAYYKAHTPLSPETIDEYYWAIDNHHNSKGYQLFANGVYAQLDSLGWLQVQSSVSNNSLVK